MIRLFLCLLFIPFILGDDFNPQDNDMRVSLLLGNVPEKQELNINDYLLIKTSKRFLRKLSTYGYIIDFDEDVLQRINSYNPDTIQIIEGNSLIEYYQRLKKKVVNQYNIVAKVLERDTTKNIYLIEKGGSEHLMSIDSSSDYSLQDIIWWINYKQIGNFDLDVWCDWIDHYNLVKFVRLGGDVWGECPL